MHQRATTGVNVLGCKACINTFSLTWKSCQSGEESSGEKEREKERKRGGKREEKKNPEASPDLLLSVELSRSLEGLLDSLGLKQNKRKMECEDMEYRVSLCVSHKDTRGDKRVCVVMPPRGCIP